MTVIAGFFLQHPPTILFHDLSDPYFAKSPETQQRLSHPIELSVEIHTSPVTAIADFFGRIVPFILFLDPRNPYSAKGPEPQQRLSLNHSVLNHSVG